MTKCISYSVQFDIMRLLLVIRISIDKRLKLQLQWEKLKAIEHNC